MATPILDVIERTVLAFGVVTFLSLLLRMDGHV